MSCNFAYFGNCFDDKISVNLNNSLESKRLDNCAINGIDGNKVINLPAASFPIHANKDKGIFGNNCYNTLQIIYESLAESHVFHITTPNLSGTDHYFYIYMGTLVGTDENGRTANIIIERQPDVRDGIREGDIECHK